MDRNIRESFNSLSQPSSLARIGKIPLDPAERALFESLDTANIYQHYTVYNIIFFISSCRSPANDKFTKLSDIIYRGM
jgi:hypothetical protein